MTDPVLLGDEAVAQGALDAGLTAAYAYPGTPSTELLDFLIDRTRGDASRHAGWASNEKTAYEQALGVSFAGRRALVAMKHVGLNVASDPFVNSALLSIGGGLVLAVADDPGMHSSQNEQDSRFYADFARVIALEPCDQQQAYEMTRDAFDLSERFEIPVMIRLVTRLAHSRSVVRRGQPREQNAVAKPRDRSAWVLLPGNARRRWRSLLDRQRAFAEYAESTSYNTLRLEPVNRSLGVITTGIARQYFEENVGELAARPSHLHVGVYPFPTAKARELLAHVDRVLVLEDGHPFVERLVRGVVRPAVEVTGRMSGHVPIDGELTPDVVRAALGLPARHGQSLDGLTLPARPPQLCQGCPHGDSFRALNLAVRAFDQTAVTSDIGCYTLGALPPHSAIESCVCMGASIGMAKGAADAGLRPAVAVIGDSTFLHSGIQPLLDVAAADTDITVVILDNGTVAMTGGQPTIVPSSRLRDVILGLGADAAHVHVLDAHPKHVERNADLIRAEMNHRGLSVIISHRECLETARRSKRKGGTE